ncbi:unnamed protein product [Echinostoma caproni]|uniref:Uncharacterized protein n=1 Tax=Echinostoma caproni TaxID=27848 RepID=A0A183A9G1_9TREM|nr:unnamed protein product [Echinostoma caproni]
MSNRRLAVVNPLSHPTVLTEKDDLDKQIEKPIGYSTPPTHSCASPNVTKSIPLPRSPFTSNHEGTHGINSADILKSPTVHVKRELRADEKDGPCDPMQSPCVRGETAVKGVTTALKSSSRLRSAEHVSVGICSVGTLHLHT